MDKSLGGYVRKRREDMDLTIRELADLCGLSHAAISMVERDKRKKPTPETLRKLAQGLGTSYEQLLREAGYLDSQADRPRKKESVDLQWILGHAEIRFQGKPFNEEQKQFLEIFLRTLFKKDEMGRQQRKSK
ncbi:helix-turn-helix domain-containing protein [Effusibacillus consociatus]|uniref:Helix-turn-helix domain-containing protein n=1 Tax=Effusibacillus consociatus TaxID=1117041 RepID=A0ABV9Q3C2_9BACL